MVDQVQRENLGPAERIINVLLTYEDHMVHNRVGIVEPDPDSQIGLRWTQATWVEKDGKKVVYKLLPGARGRNGKTTRRKVEVGTLWNDGTVRSADRRKIGELRQPGLFPEVAVWMYRQVAEIYKLDNEFCARWASYAYSQTHRDLKVVLAAFLLVQARKGDPVMDQGKVAFFDDDFRDVGEAMCLHYGGKSDKSALDAKLLLRIRKILEVPEIAQINRDLGFGKSARRAYLGRWPRVVQKWLRYREDNPVLLRGLVNKGAFRATVQDLAQQSRYSPSSPLFYQILRWPQKQADGGHRKMALDQKVTKQESWAGKTEQEICEIITSQRTGWKRVTTLVPSEIGVTRAIMAAAVEAGSLSDKDLINHTPLLEELGLLQDQDVRGRWEAALQAAEDRRAANVARNVKSQQTREQLEGAADQSVLKAVEEVATGIRVFFCVDRSSSMGIAIEAAKEHIEKFLPGFPPDQLFICAFNSSARKVTLKQHSSVGVREAFRGMVGSGGTDYGAAVRFFSKPEYMPAEEEVSLFFFIGDEAADTRSLVQAVRNSDLNIVAFALVKVVSPGWDPGLCVQEAAAQLGIPVIPIDEKVFSDVYATPRILRDLIANTPVAQTPGHREVRRVTLLDTILDTELLKKPLWAA